MRVEQSEETIWRITPEGESLEDILRAFVIATYNEARCFECVFGLPHEDEPLTAKEADRLIRRPADGFGTAVHFHPSPFADVPPIVILELRGTLIFDASDFATSGFSPEKLLARVEGVLRTQFVPQR